MIILTGPVRLAIEDNSFPPVEAGERNYNGMAGISCPLEMVASVDPGHSLPCRTQIVR